MKASFEPFWARTGCGLRLGATGFAALISDVIFTTEAQRHRGKTFLDFSVSLWLCGERFRESQLGSRFFFGVLPGRLAGFSWVFSRKTPFMPPARPTLPSPNLSRRRSA